MSAKARRPSQGEQQRQRPEPDLDHGKHSAHGASAPGELPEGWSRPRPEHVPRPTYWPLVLAFGLTFFFWGFISTWIISAIGLVVFGVALTGWIGELRHGD